MRVKHAKKRTWWMMEFEIQTVDAGIYPHGKVDWETASHLYNTGRSVENCVLRMLEARQIKDLRGEP